MDNMYTLPGDAVIAIDLAFVKGLGKFMEHDSIDWPIRTTTA